jgi:diaminohydroxyphosphoribosylaminopyrimidine deaminase/5-amino-6-(5-phosphoribosylamino)uracil reductase
VELNLPFLVPRLLGRPEVTVKWAMSLDGKIATASGESQWISSPAGRRWGLAQREEHDAILVGSGTVLADDPRLDRRLGLAPTDPERPFVRAVLDRRLRTPPTARMLAIGGPVLVYTSPHAGGGAGASSGAESGAPARRALEAAGAAVVALDEVTPDAVLADLRRRGVDSVLVEGGAGVAGAFVAAGAFDRVAVDCAPLLVGGDGASGPLGGAGAGTLAGAPRLERLATHRRGGDLIITGLRQRCLPDLLRSLDASSKAPGPRPEADSS